MNKRSKGLVLALFLLLTSLVLCMAISADYTTDGDDATAVDYIIMDAEDVKAATGTKGTLMIDENGYLVTKYTPSESYYTAGDSGMLKIVPANSDAGFAATGENSLFDFTYYVIRYKTSGSIYGDNTNLVGGSVTKWAGSQQIVASANWGYRTINREKFTAGNAESGTAIANTKTNQTIGYKLFATSDADGYIMIESIAAFRTEDQATDYIANYVPKTYDFKSDGNDATSLDFVIMDAAAILKASNDKGVIIKDDARSVVKYTPATCNTSSALKITPANAGVGFAATGDNSFFDFPYYVINLKTSGVLHSDNTNLIGSGIYKWLGNQFIGNAADYTYRTVLRDSHTSGNDGTSTPLDKTKTNQMIQLKMFSSADAEGYVYIESIAAFRTPEQVTAYKMLYEPTSADKEGYMTDNNKTTDVDYIIMNEDDLLIAGSNKGTIVTETDGNKVIRYSAADSYYTPYSAPLQIKPALTDAGFAESGDNSLLDFSYYVVRIKTTGSIYGDNSTLCGGSIQNWGGNQFAGNAADWSYRIIKRDSYKTGSSGNVLLTKGLTNQYIGLKMFASAEAEGFAYIDLIAAFRTKEQADNFVVNYVPEREENASERLVLNADSLNTVVNCTAFDTDYVYEEANGKAYVKFTAKENGTHQDGSQFDFNFAKNSLTKGFTIKDYPIVKISYKSDIANKGAVIDFCVGVNYLGKATRVWGYMPSYDHSGEFTTMTFDMSKSFTGGEGITNYSYDNINADSVYNYITFKPWASGAIVKDEMFAVEYIGFFKTIEDANAYTFEIDKTLIDIKTDFNAKKLGVNDTVQVNYTPFPAYADVSNVTYTSSDTAVATVTNAGLVTAVGTGKAIITVEDTETGISKEVVIAVQADTPLALYGKDSENGEAVVLNVIGDSISAGVGVTDKTNTYHGRWAKALKMSVNNWSLGGSAITGDYKQGGNLIETFVPRMERMVATTENPDIVLIYGGTNDYNGNWTIGKVTDKDRSTYYGAIHELIELSLINYPEAKLVFVTPIKRCDYGNGGSDDNTGFRRYELDAYVDAMIAACEYHDIDCIDLYNNEQANLIGKRVDYIRDGVHMTEAGHEIFSKVLLAELIKAGVVTTVDYTPEPAGTITLDPERDLTAENHIYDATALNTLATYEAGTLIDRQRMSKHTLVNNALRFSPETLTSKLAPTITVDLSKLDFAVTDYPYMSVVYKTNSASKDIDVALRGNDNRVSAISTLPSLKADELSAFTLNVKDYSCADIPLTGDTLHDDLYLTMSFFDKTTDMTADSYVDIAYIAFFKTAADAAAFNSEKAPEVLYGDVNGDSTINLIDAIVLSRYVANWTGYDDDAIVNANSDVNADGEAGACDVIILARHLANWKGYEKLPYTE